MRSNFVKTGRLAACIAGAALVGAFASSPARADIVGQLQCNIAGGAGQVISSQRAVSCVFRSNAGPAQLYNGTLGRLGVDIGNQTSGTLTYQVIAIGTPAPGALAGKYLGGGFGISLGTGGGISGLVGVNNSAISFQPVAVTTGTGDNVNAGASALDLQFAGLEPPMGMARHHRHHRRMMHHRHHM